VARLLLAWRTWVYVACAVVMVWTVAGPLEMRENTGLYVSAVADGARVDATVIDVGVDPARLPLTSTRSFHEVAWVDGTVRRSAKLAGVPPREQPTVEIMLSPDGTAATSSLARSAANMQAMPATMLFLSAFLLASNLLLVDGVRAVRRHRRPGRPEAPIELKRLTSSRAAA
jgi:hypothetical protein